MTGAPNGSQPPPPVLLQMLIIQVLQLCQELSQQVLTGRFDHGNFEIEIREKAIVTPPSGPTRLVQR